MVNNRRQTESRDAVAHSLVHCRFLVCNFGDFVNKAESEGVISVEPFPLFEYGQDVGHRLATPLSIYIGEYYISLLRVLLRRGQPLHQVGHFVRIVSSPGVYE